MPVVCEAMMSFRGAKRREIFKTSHPETSGFEVTLGKILKIEHKNEEELTWK